jgi:uncharacterized protein
MTTLLLALGLVFILEGLVLALAPSRLEDLLRMLSTLPEDTRRLIGMLAITGGGILMTLAVISAGG